MRRTIFPVLIVSGIIFLTFSVHPVLPAAPLSATAVAERTDVFVGEPVTFQIEVSGSENPEKPDISGIRNFNVEFLGGQQNSSRTVTIINGRLTQNVREGYVFTYRLIPRSPGRLTIPSLTVHADGRSAGTQKLVINARTPVETDDFKLRLKLSKEYCYVGEPVTLTVTWYIGKDVQSFDFNLPLLGDDRFHFADPGVDMHSGKRLYRIPLEGGEVIGEKGRSRLENRDFATITFEKILIPKKPGDMKIEPATVSCSALIGYEKRRSPFEDDFFSDFFDNDFFGRSRRGIYRNVVVPSNSLTLRVCDLPEKGRPDNFAGHVGEYRLEASATPREISVGDPITLTITLSGPEYLEHVKLPPLNEQPKFARDFKIPRERAAGEISGKSKIFTQTIRALRTDVREIPSFEFPYFDTLTGAYRIARTEPIPIHVKETRVITVLDAEGIAERVLSGSEIETWSKGIAFNYEDMSVIEDQRFGPVSWLKSPLWMSLLILPSVAYLALLAGTGFLRRRNSDPLKIRAKKAYGNLVKSLKHARRTASAREKCDIVLNAFRNYLGDKLRMSGGTLTYNDVKDRLAAKGVGHGILVELKELFEKCEAGRYAGAASITDAGQLTEQGLQLAKDLEKKLK